MVGADGGQVRTAPAGADFKGSLARPACSSPRPSSSDSAGAGPRRGAGAAAVVGAGAGVRSGGGRSTKWWVAQRACSHPWAGQSAGAGPRYNARAAVGSGAGAGGGAGGWQWSKVGRGAHTMYVQSHVCSYELHITHGQSLAACSANPVGFSSSPLARTSQAALLKGLMSHFHSHLPECRGSCQRRL